MAVGRRMAVGGWRAGTGFSRTFTWSWARRAALAIVCCSLTLMVVHSAASAGCATTFTTNTHVGEISPRLSARHQKKYERSAAVREREALKIAQ